VVFEEIPEEECLELLAAGRFGRIAVVVDTGPLVFPVNYAFDGGRVAIRTDPGTKLAAAALARVAFEIDDVDEEQRTGWSVLVQGTGHDISDSVDDVSQAMRSIEIETWAPGQRGSWIRIEPTAVTGRRVRRA
jgi:nitroimidazol reductase NimA-like FMN-containing flavoprotein (pyridoxamine 5'-phosphate oxidase superfamily)